jgi:formylglycine-generating enzyme required for sulfatase activity
LVFSVVATGCKSNPKAVDGGISTNDGGTDAPPDGAPDSRTDVMRGAEGGPEAPDVTHGSDTLMPDVSSGSDTLLPDVPYGSDGLTPKDPDASVPDSRDVTDALVSEPTEPDAAENQLGLPCKKPEDCGPGTFCQDGVCCGKANCGPCLNCGSDGMCSILVSSAQDSTGFGCSGTSSCSAEGVCGKKLGKACSLGSECFSANCVDGLCCGLASCPQCQRCAEGGGSCVNLPYGTDVKVGTTCTGTRTCDGTGACKKKEGQGCSGNVECASGSCAGGLCAAPPPPLLPPPPSCNSLAATCGPDGSESCCTSLLVPGGTFNRGNDARYPATVRDFFLDKYEITVGRFRKFVEAGQGTQASAPGIGAGGHPLIGGSGWDPGWNTMLAADVAGLKKAINCTSPPNWTDTPGANENHPMDCMDWYTAFAFCAWDGGRLATEAEWTYAAAGGSEQRAYPWGSTVPDNTYAVFNSTVQIVGSKAPKGNGKWGQADLAGNLWEWVLDFKYSGSPREYVLPCDNCACLAREDNRVILGGSFINYYDNTYTADPSSMQTPEIRYKAIGSRCARDVR